MFGEWDFPAGQLADQLVDLAESQGFGEGLHALTLEHPLLIFPPGDEIPSLLAARRTEMLGALKTFALHQPKAKFFELRRAETLKWEVVL